MTLQPSARGLTTGAMPAPDGRLLEVGLDLVDHTVDLRTSDGESRCLALGPRPVADFYEAYRAALAALGVEASLWPVPVELPTDALPFPEDRVHEAYDPEAAHRFFLALVGAWRAMSRFRSRFVGKQSPAQFFWGSFDLAVTRFSGRTAPPHPGGFPHVGDQVMREAYSHELWNAGFWPGSGAYPAPAFFAYAYPAPPGFAEAPVRPDGAAFDAALGEFVLPYDVARETADPEEAVLDFLQSTYEAAAGLGGWERGRLERRPPGDEGDGS